MAIKLTQKIVTVTTAGTPVQFSLPRIKAPSMIITADPANTGTVWIGDQSVKASTSLGLPLVADDSVTIDPSKYFGTNEQLDLSLFWVDSTVSGDKIIISYYEREVD